jgi:hypothetical protein
MLLKIGLATIAVSLLLAAGVAATVGLRDETAETVFFAEPRAALESTAQEREFDLGRRLEIDDEVDKDGGVVEQDDGNIEDAGPSPHI